MSIPVNPVYVVGKAVDTVIHVSAAQGDMIPTRLSSRRYRLRLCGGVHVSVYSNRPNRVLNRDLSLDFFSGLWRSTLPNVFTKDPPDATISYARWKPLVKCVNPCASSPAGLNCCGQVGGGSSVSGASLCCTSAPNPCDPCTVSPCNIGVLVGEVTVNGDGSLDLHYELSQDIKEFPTETLLSTVSITFHNVFIPPLGPYTLIISPSKSCPYFDSSGCNSNSDSAISRTYSVYFAEEGTEMRFNDVIDTSGTSRRTTIAITYPRDHTVQLHMRNGSTVESISQERNDRVGTGKFTLVWVYTFNSPIDPPDWLPDYAFAAHWTLIANEPLPNDKGRI